jgi:membrane dipeptidase|tara:strand:+ start:283 stop:1563 length:1281 start_codon:yes stop_codon:yes gene_type:complete
MLGIYKSAAYLLLLSALWSMSQAAWSQSDDEAMTQAKEVLRTAPIVDGHNDLPWVIREKFGGDVEQYDISVRAQLDTDIPRLLEGMVGTQFWSVYVPSSLSPLDAMQAQLEQIDIARRIINFYPDTFMFATSVSDIEAAREQGKIASLLGMEGGHTIVNSLGALRSYYDLGVRYMTLTHFHSNDWADSATDDARHEGITDFGREVIHEMNRMGMMVDLSHVSIATMNDVLDIAAAPVIFSHSSARALTDHTRNVPDRVLERVSENGGVVMVTFIPAYVLEERRVWEDGMIPLLKDTTTVAEWEQVVLEYREVNGAPPLASLSNVADHIEHVAKIAGIDHVGIGSDFYGAQGDELIQGLEDVSRFPYLIAELARRGWSNEDLAKVSRENLLRAFGDVEITAARLQQTRPPSLSTIEELDGLHEPAGN